MTFSGNPTYDIYAREKYIGSVHFSYIWYFIRTSHPLQADVQHLLSDQFMFSVAKIFFFVSFLGYNDFSVDRDRKIGLIDGHVDITVTRPRKWW